MKAAAWLALALLGHAAAIPPAPAGLTDPYEIAEEAGRVHGLPPYLMRALVKQESYGDPRALSRAGAMGLTQLMPGTARDLGVTDPWDPWQNAWGGARYLRQQLNTFGRLDLALAAYNAGPGNVITHGGVPPFAETREYVSRITRDYNTWVATFAPAALPAPLKAASPPPTVRPAPVVVPVPVAAAVPATVKTPTRTPAAPAVRAAPTSAPQVRAVPPPSPPAQVKPPANLPFAWSTASLTPATPAASSGAFSLVTTPLRP